MKSLPVVGLLVMARRSPHGERGLKYVGVKDNGKLERRSPHGERGLKFIFLRSLCIDLLVSLPSRGARIEMHATYGVSGPLYVAPLTGSAD